MIKKNDYGSYEAPEAILFSVRAEVFCTSPVYGPNGQAGSDTDDENYGDF